MGHDKLGRGRTAVSPRLRSRIRARRRDGECGASLVEYILLVALIALGVMGAAVFLAQRASGKFTDAGDAIATTATTTDAICPPGYFLKSTEPHGTVTEYRCESLTSPGSSWVTYRPNG